MSKVSLSKISGQDLKPQVFEAKNDRYRPWHRFLRGRLKMAKGVSFVDEIDGIDDFMMISVWICLSQKDFGGRVFGGMARNLSNGPQVLPAMVIRGESELQRFGGIPFLAGTHLNLTFAWIVTHFLQENSGVARNGIPPRERTSPWCWSWKGMLAGEGKRWCHQSLWRACSPDEISTIKVHGLPLQHGHTAIAVH